MTKIYILYIINFIQTVQNKIQINHIKIIFGFYWEKMQGLFILWTVHSEDEKWSDPNDVSKVVQFLVYVNLESKEWWPTLLYCFKSDLPRKKILKLPEFNLCRVHINYYHI